jgi:hypothetical protein
VLLRDRRLRDNRVEDIGAEFIFAAHVFVHSILCAPVQACICIRLLERIPLHEYLHGIR